MSEQGQELLALQARHQQLLREHAVLEAREAEKARRRDELRALLREAGVDPDQPEAELARLEAENQQTLAENKRRLDEFEAQLRAANPHPNPPALPTEELAPEDPAKPSTRTPRALAADIEIA